MRLIDLFLPRWRCRDRGARLRAVSELMDQALLARVARTDPDVSIRLVAVRKITDEAVLAEIAAREADPLVRLAARTRAVGGRM